MKRNQAIEKLAFKKLKELSEEERAEQLEIMTLEDWSESGGWELLPKEVKNEFEDRELIGNPNSEKYDQVLLIWIKEGLQSVTNDFLRDDLGIESIEGEPIKLISCPCCGSRTIGERGNYEICKVCWWEDDGQDNESADKVYGGPNYGISLTQGRYNFLKFELYDPERKDLMKNREPISKYERGRKFEIIGEYVIEKGTNWKGKIKANA
jgi:hypothetical protein